MFQKLAVLGAWASFGLICFVTLSPIGLRPSTGDAGLERFVAYAMMGGLFIGAYPRQFVRVASFVIVVAMGLEALQHLTPDRHGHVVDALQKAIGGLVGASLTRLSQILLEARTGSGQKPPETSLSP